LSKIINYSQQSINREDIISVSKTLKSKYLTTGPNVIKFEKKIRKFVDAKYCASFNSATSALHVACLALNLNSKDIVWVSSISFVASANCAAYCGAKVDFIDIDKDTFNICLISLKKKLEIAKKKQKLPKVLIIVHLGGLPSSLKEIKKLSNKYNFKIIEDASHALGSSIFNHKIGSCKYSCFTIFSFHPVKNITTAEGGAITTNSHKYFKKILLLREHGIERNFRNFVNKNSTPFYYEQQFLGYNYRLSELHASLGISQLKRIKSFIKKRNIIRSMYQKGLKNLPIKFQLVDKNYYSSNHLVIIRVNKKIRNALINYLFKKGYKTNIHYIPIFYHPFYYKKFYLSNINAIEYYEEALSLPCFFDLNFYEVTKIINHIKFFLNFKMIK